MTSFLLDKNMTFFCYSLLFFKLYTNIFECLELPVTQRTDRDKTIPLSLNGVYKYHLSGLTVGIGVYFTL